MVALESLNLTNTQLQATQKQISTGYRVADATDDGAAYAVAQSVRSNVAALTSANQQLQNSSGLLSATTTGLNAISNQMTTMHGILVKLADGTCRATSARSISPRFRAISPTSRTTSANSNYNGQDADRQLRSRTGYGNVHVIRNEQGSQYTINATAASGIYSGMTQLGGATQTATTISAALTATGAFTTQFNAVSSALNQYGNASDYVNAQVTFNSNRIDAMNSGMGALVDANLSQEAANLQALQTRQQLATQSLSIANQAPNSLLSLFK